MFSSLCTICVLGHLLSLLSIPSSLYLAGLPRCCLGACLHASFLESIPSSHRVRLFGPSLSRNSLVYPPLERPACFSIASASSLLGLLLGQVSLLSIWPLPPPPLTGSHCIAPPASATPATTPPLASVARHTRIVHDVVIAVCVAAGACAHVATLVAPHVGSSLSPQPSAPPACLDCGAPHARRDKSSLEAATSRR